MGAVLLLLLVAGCSPNLGAVSPGWSPVAAAPGLVYVATKQGAFMALADDGSDPPPVKWSYCQEWKKKQCVRGPRGAYAAPVVGEELVYLAAVDGYLYALDKETGTIGESRGWRQAASRGEKSQPLIGGPALDPQGNVVVVGSQDGNLYAFNARTGDPLPWSPLNIGNKIWSTPAIQDGVVYFGSHDRHVYAVSLKDGQVRWRFPTGGALVARPLLFKDTVVIGAFDKKLYALAARDGELRWEFQAKNWFWAGAVASDTTIYAPSMDGHIYALDRNGNLLWKHRIGSPIVSTPALLTRGLVVAGKNGKLSLLDPSPKDIGPTREVSFLFLRKAQINASLFPLGESVFVGAQDSTVRRIKVRGSLERGWCFDTAAREAETRCD